MRAESLIEMSFSAPTPGLSKANTKFDTAFLRRDQEGQRFFLLPQSSRSKRKKSCGEDKKSEMKKKTCFKLINQSRMMKEGDESAVTQSVWSAAYWGKEDDGRLEVLAQSNH